MRSFAADPKRPGGRPRGGAHAVWFATDQGLFELLASAGKGWRSPSRPDLLIFCDPGLAIVSWVELGINGRIAFDRVNLNRFAWMPESFDRDCIYGQESLGRATYSNLYAGNSRMRVKAANPDGVRNEPAALLEVTVLPSFWRTWW